jgi:hypothetical protein
VPKNPPTSASTTKRLVPVLGRPEPNVSPTLPTLTTPWPKAKPPPGPASKQVDKSEVL